MKLRTGVLAAAVVGILAGFSTSAQALVVVVNHARDIPYEFVVTEADTVVVASVTSVTKPEQPVAPPAGGRARPAIQPFRGQAAGDVKFKIEEIIADPAKTDLKDKEIEVQIGMVAKQVPNVGDKVMMAIKNSGEGNKYYVLPYTNAYVVGADAIDKAKKEFAKAGDLDKWNWGKESNGLRAVALVRNLQPTSQVSGSGMVQVSLGLQNVSKDSIYINTFPGDRCLTLKAWAEGAPITANLMNTAEGSVYEGQAYVAEIKPGALVWVSQWGPSPEGTAFSVQNVEGKFVMKAAYKSSRENNGGGTKFWQGEVIAGEISADMPKAPPQRVPVRGGTIRGNPGGTIQIQPLVQPQN